MSDLVYFPEAEFCHQYINNDQHCWALCCRFLHGTRDEEAHHKNTGMLDEKWVPIWNELQRIRSLGPDVICLDHKRNKCFRKYCRMGGHPMPRTDADSQNLVEFEFVGDITLKNYLKDDLKLINYDWSYEVICHRRAPFQHILEHIMKCLRPFGLRRENVRFSLRNSANQGGVEVTDNDTPDSLEVYGDDLIKVNVVRLPRNFAGAECPICIGPIYVNAAIKPCGHEFCRDCIFTWFNSGAFSASSGIPTCPLCRALVYKARIRGTHPINRVLPNYFTRYRIENGDTIIWNWQW